LHLNVVFLCVAKIISKSTRKQSKGKKTKWKTNLTFVQESHMLQNYLTKKGKPECIEDYVLCKAIINF